MKRRVGLSVAALLAGASPTWAVNEFPITTGGTAAIGWEWPQVRIDGNTAVWMDFRNGPNDLYTYNFASRTSSKVYTFPGAAGGDMSGWTWPSHLAFSGNTIVSAYGNWYDAYYVNTATGSATTIGTPNRNPQPPLAWYPAIDGDVIITTSSLYWKPALNKTNHLWGYRVSTQTLFDITDATVPGSTLLTDAVWAHPDLSGDLLVWDDYRNGNWDIYGRNIATGQEFSIYTGAGDQRYPKIEGNTVIWQDDRNGNWDIYDYNLATGQSLSICTTAGDHTYPQLSGDTVVWQDNRNGNWDIYGYNLGAGAEFPICTDPADQNGPDVAGNHVVWTDYRNVATGDNPNIYAAAIPEPASLSLLTLADLPLLRRRRQRRCEH